MKKHYLCAVLACQTLVYLLTCINLSAAQPDRWTSGGPAGGYVNHIEYAASNADIIYAGTVSGVYKSTNAGENWTLSGLSGMDIHMVRADPTDADIVYALVATIPGYSVGADDGLYKSVDGGLNWTRKMHACVTAVAIDSSQPNTLYLGTKAGQIYKSLNGGNESVLIHTETYSGTGVGINSILVDPDNPLNIYVGTGILNYVWTGSRGFLKSTNGGSTWTGRRIGEVSGKDLGDCLVMTPDGYSPKTLFIIAQASFTLQLVYMSLDLGESWFRLEVPVLGAFGYSYRSARTLCVDLKDPDWLYVGTNNPDYPFIAVNHSLNKQGLINDFNDCETNISPVKHPDEKVILPDGQILNRSAEAHDFKTVPHMSASYAVPVFEGLEKAHTPQAKDVGSEGTDFRYDDGTAVSRLGFDAEFATLNTIEGAVHFHNAVINEMSWYLDSHGGPHNTVKVWVLGLDAIGLPDRNNIIYTAEDVPNTDNEWNTHVFPESLEAPEGFFIGLSYEGYLGLATDDGSGAPWGFVGRTQFGIFDISDTDIPFTPIENWGFRVNFLLRAHGVDHGEITYHRIPAGLPVGQIPSCVAPNPHTPDVVYVGYGNGKLYKSTDQAMIFEALESGLNNALINDMAIHPVYGERALAAIDGYGTLQMTTDAGSSWSGLSSFSERFGAVAVDPRHPGRLFAGTAGSLGYMFRSENAGDTWVRIDSQSSNGKVKDIWIHPDSPDTVLILKEERVANNYTYFGGVRRSTDGGDSWSFVFNWWKPNCLAADPDNPDIVYMGVERLGYVYRSVNAGMTWVNISPMQQWAYNVYDIAVDTNGDVYAAISDHEDHPYGGVWKLDESWHRVGAFDDTEVTALAIDLDTDPGTLYAGTSDAGVYVSDDGGNNWMPFNDGLEILNITKLAISTAPPKILYAGTKYGGVWSIPLSVVYTITASAGDNGSIQPSGEVLVEEGEGQAFVITPDDGFHIAAIEVNGSAINLEDDERWSAEDNTFTFHNVTQNHSIEAVFSINTYLIEAQANNSNFGSISGAGSYEHFEEVELVATSAEGCFFLNWTEAGSEVFTDSSYTFIAEGDRNLIANFDIHRFTLTYHGGDNGSIGGETTQTVAYGSDGTEVEAIPDEGYHFVEWSDGGNTAKRTDTNVKEDLTVTAAFSINIYTVAAMLNNEAYGTVTGAGDYKHGESVTLTAASSDVTRFIFKNWTEEGSQVHDQPAYSFTATADRTLLANFQDVTSVASRGEIQGVKVYPIPVGDILMIESEVMLEQLCLMDVLGRVHFSENVNQMRYSLKISHLQEGVYVIIATTTEGMSIHRVQIAR